MIAMYANRGGYLMAIGRPAAQVGLYHPGNTIWLGGDAATEADRSTTKLGWQLFEHQVDWDYFDEQSLSSVATLANGGFTNLSGQTYKAIVLPSMTVITRTGLARLQEFAQAGRQGDLRRQDAEPDPGQDVHGCEGEAGPELRHADRAVGRHYAGGACGAAQAGCEAGRGVPETDLHAPPSGPTATCTSSSTRATRRSRAWRPSRDTAQAQDWDLATGEIHPMSGATADGRCGDRFRWCWGRMRRR